MNTPICDFVSRYAQGNALRMHMPGHKGAELLGMEALDVTEIEGADVLYSATGIIAESERNASELFGSGRTVYSTEGSSLSIRAMLYLALLWGKDRGRRPVIFAGRNAHRVFHSAVALLDIDVVWLSGKNDTLMSADLTPDILDGYLSAATDKPIAVYLTSPDYLGNTLDIKGLSEVAKKHGVLCLVDNAHGAYLHFLESSEHPIALGAHICADSAHKTLPALTGAAYLHISKDAPPLLSLEAESAMALFASTSPSYLILQSLDAVNKYLSDGYGQRLRDFCKKTAALKAELTRYGYKLIGNEPLKISIDAKAYGYLGSELYAALMDNNIVCEHADRDTVVLMLTPETGDGGLARLRDALISIKKKESIGEKPPRLTPRITKISAREAIMSPKEKIPTDKALGRILADLSVSCPPAIPIVTCGEIIDENAIELFEYYGIDTVSVIK